jgi:hypothetical protein
MTLRPVRKGEIIPMPAIEKDGNRGGFSRKPAPGDGAAWDAGDSCGWVGVEQLELVVEAIRKGKRR